MRLNRSRVVGAGPLYCFAPVPKQIAYKCQVVCIGGQCTRTSSFKPERAVLTSHVFERLCSPPLMISVSVLRIDLLEQFKA